MVIRFTSKALYVVWIISIFSSVLSAYARPHHTNKTLDTPQYRLEFTTDFPIQLGLGAIIELDHRIRLQSTLGWMPKSYIRTTNDLVHQIIPESYPPETAQLVEDTIKNSLVWTIKGGWRPFENSGFYFNVGYTLITLGGGSTTKDLIEGITGVSTEERQYNNDSDHQERQELPINAAASLHLAALDLGWEWNLIEYNSRQKLIFRTALGFSYTFTSSAELITQSNDPRPRYQDALKRLESAGEAYLIDTFESYIHPPSVSIAIGYTW